MGVITLPRLGETMEEARVTAWAKAPGEPFRRGELLLEVETDKTAVEVPALGDGVLVAQLVAPGETVSVGQPIAEVEAAAGREPAVKEADAEVSEEVPTSAGQEEAAVAAVPPAPAGSRPPASGRARRLAREAGVALAAVAGTGRRGRITGADVAAAAKRGGTERVPTTAGAVALRRLAGTAVPVVLLHGLFDSGRGWRDLPERLARQGHPVVVPDLPSHGATEAGAATPAEAAEALAQVLASVLPAGPLRLAGHSLGAVLAAMLAERLGARVERLVLLAPVGLGPRLNPDFFDLMAAAETPAALRRALVLVDPAPVSDAALAAELERLAGRRAAMARLARAVAVAGIQQLDLAARLAGVAAPVAAVFGLEDRIVDWRDAAGLGDRVAVHLLRGAGHLPHAAAPELVADLIAGAGPEAQRAAE